MSDTWDSAPLAPAAKVPKASTWDSAPTVGPSTQQKAVASANDNPEDAARALSISKRTALPATVVQSDVPAYESHARQQSAIKASENPYIAKYIDGNPMAPKVSADDYDQLDVVSKAIQAMSPKEVTAASHRQVVNSIPELNAALATAPGREKLANAAMNLPFTLLEDVVQTTREGTQGSLASIMAPVNRARAGDKGESFWGGFVNQFKDTASVGAGAAGLLFSPFLPVVGVAKTAIARPLAIAEGMPLQDVTSDVGKALMGLGVRGKPSMAPSGDFDGFMAELRGKQTRSEIDEFLRKKAEGDGPPGAMLQIEHAKQGEAALTKAVEVAQESKTKVRSPEMFEELAKAHDDSVVHISGDKIVDLYQKAGKVPAEGDGLFGFVPGIAERAAAAAATGGEVTIPVSKYIAHVDPTVHEGLKDAVRLHDDGVTLEEAEAVKESIKPIEIDEAQQDAAAAALPPVQPGMVRFFHGGVAPTSGGGRWVAPDYKYARDYTRMAVRDEATGITTIGPPREVHYVDVPEKTFGYDEINNYYRNVELPEEYAKQLQPVIKGKEAEPVTPAQSEKKKTGVDTEVFMNMLLEKGQSIGVTEREFEAYSKKVSRQEEAILERQAAIGKREAGRRLAPEWRRNEAKVRDEVTTEFRETGVFAAEKFLRENKITLGGDNIDTVADNLAPLFGFQTGDELRRALTGLETEQAASGKAPQRQIADAIKAETARRMEERYGNLAANIAKEAREIALADHTFDVLADEVRILARAAGGTSPVGRNEMVSWAKRSFEGSNIVEGGNWEKHRRAVEKNGREAEKALLKGDFAEAFMWKQRQFLAATIARESAALQGVVDRAEKKIDRFSTEETIEGLSQPYLEQLRQMLASVGLPQHFAPLPNTGALRDFVVEHEGQIAVAPWLMDGSQPKLQDMSVAQFRDFVASMKSVEHVGRQAEKLFSARGEAELQNVVFDIKKELERFKFVDQPINPSLPQRVKAIGRRIIGAHLLVERMFDYTDKFNPDGPITTYIDRPLRDSNRKELELTEKASKMLRDLYPLTDASVLDLVPNNVIPDKMAKSGFMQMTHQNLRQLMLNMGNWSNIKKLAEGFGVNEADLRRFVDANATAKDVAYVNGVWRVFKMLKPEADAMQLRDTGVPADTIEAVPWAVKGGELEGGYYPIVYDKYNSDIQGHRAMQDPVFQNGYISATTPHGYTVARTDYKGALDLEGAHLASRIQGMIHDIAFREAVRSTNRLISNQEFRTALAQRWGKEYADLLPGWLRDIANSHKLDDQYAQGFARSMALIRQNVISTLIAFNPSTVIKHGFTAALMSAERVGFVDLAKATKELGLKDAAETAKDLVRRGESVIPDEVYMQAFRDSLDQGERGESLRNFVLQSSAVMRNRSRQVDDSVRGAIDKMNEVGATGLFKNLREKNIQYGRFAVAFSDQMSAVPTWYAAYKQAYLSGKSHEDSVFIADKEVSRAHGSSFTGDAPMITRIPNSLAGEVMKLFTPLYKFYNHFANNNFQFVWDANAALHGNPNGEPGANAARLSRHLAVVLMTLIIEEQASAALDKDKKGALHSLLMKSVHLFGGQFIGLREITSGLSHGYGPASGLLGTIWKAGEETVKDIGKGVGVKAGLAKNWIKHTADTIGFATGLGGSQLGRTGQFLMRVGQGREVPRSEAEWRQGLRTGSMKARVH